MLRNVSRDLIEGQPVNPGRDKGPYLWTVNLRRSPGPVFTAVIADRRGWLRQGVQALMKAGFNGGFKGCDCPALRGMAGAQFGQCLDKMIAGAGCHYLPSFR